MNARSLVRLVAALALGAAMVWAFLNRSAIEPGQIADAVGRLGAWGPVAYVLLYGAATVLFVPGTLFGLAAGALFGPWWGTVWSLVGATFGATLAFLVARHLAAAWVRRRVGGRLGQLVEGVEAEGWRFVALVRLVPLIPFNLLNYALGLTRIPLAAYVVASAIAMIPGTAAYVWLGHAGREALAGGDSALRGALIGLGLLALVALAARLAWRVRASRRGATAAGAPSFAWVDADGLRGRLGTVDVIDVRGPGEFDGPLGHVEGAVNIPLDELPARLPGLEALRTRPVVLVCHTDRRSALAAGLLAENGFGNVAVLRGGMVAWRQNRDRVAAMAQTAT